MKHLHFPKISLEWRCEKCKYSLCSYSETRNVKQDCWLFTCSLNCFSFFCCHSSTLIYAKYAISSKYHALIWNSCWVRFDLKFMLVWIRFDLKFMLRYALMISNSLLAGERVLLECQQRIDFHKPCFPWFSNCNIHCVEHAVYTLPNWFKTPKLGCQLECQRRNFHHTVSKDQPYSILLIRFFLKGAAVRCIFLGIRLLYTKCCLCMI